MAKKKHEAPAPVRRWIKLYCAESLRGSISIEPLDTQAIWFKLLLMAGDSRIDGIICATKGVPYPHKRIATTLGIRLPQLELCLRKFKEQERISEDGDGIHITKWHTYQAPYQIKMWKEEESAKSESSEETPAKSSAATRTKEPWMEEKDLKRDAKQMWVLASTDKEAWQKFHDRLTRERRQQISDYITTHPEIKGMQQ